MNLDGLDVILHDPMNSPMTWQLSNRLAFLDLDHVVRRAVHTNSFNSIWSLPRFALCWKFVSFKFEIRKFTCAIASYSYVLYVMSPYVKYLSALTWTDQRNFIRTGKNIPFFTVKGSTIRMGRKEMREILKSKTFENPFQNLEFIFSWVRYALYGSWVELHREEVSTKPKVKVKAT